MDCGVKGKVVAITGGSSGIGKSVVYKFLHAGCKVAVCGKNDQKLAALRDSCLAKGHSVMTSTVDVSNTDALHQFAARVYEEFGKIDVWINNAGINLNKPIFDSSESDWDSIISVNLKGVFFGCKAAAHFMKEENGGVILNASSYQAIMPILGCSIYAASKAGVLNLTKSLAGELAPYNIRVVAYIPGLVLTGLTRDAAERNREEFVKSIALNRFGEPEEIADLLLFLASDAAKYITGTSVEVSGGKFCVQNQNFAW